MAGFVCLLGHRDARLRESESAAEGAGCGASVELRPAGGAVFFQAGIGAAAELRRSITPRDIMAPLDGVGGTEVKEADHPSPPCGPGSARVRWRRKSRKLAKEGSIKQAVGIWLRGLSDSHRFLVQGLPAPGHRCGCFLALTIRGVAGTICWSFPGSTQSLQELAELLAPLGRGGEHLSGNLGDRGPGGQRHLRRRID